MRFAFNDFELDSDKFELRKNGVLVPLEPQVFALLKFLVERREEMVSKDAIIEAVWDGRIVSDAAIASRIRLARQAVDDDGTTQHTIRTIHGRGFRFVASVSAPPRLRMQPVPDASGENVALAEPQQNPKPSIVVLPFHLLGDAGTNSIIADAIPHDLIQALSQLRWLFVIARGSAFRFRAREPDVRQIGEALNVRYCLFGSIEIINRTAAITLELSETRDGGIVWSDRISAALDNVHDIRSDIVARVVSSLETHIPLNEARVARLGVPEGLDAWSNYHLALQHMFRFTKEDNAAATALFERAVALDPGFARAYAGLSFTHMQDAFVKYTPSVADSAQNARRFAERALELDPLDPFANFTMGRYFWLEGALDSSGDWLDRTLALSPNYAQGIYSRAFTDMLRGRVDSARNDVNLAERLSPLDPLLYGMLGTRTLTYIAAGDYETAAQWGERAARAPGAHFLISMIALAAHTLDGNGDKASHWIDDIKRRHPTASQSEFFHSFPFSDMDLRKRISGAFAKHGI